MSLLDNEIKEIKDQLPKTLKNNFDKCVNNIKQGNYRHLRGSEDALSAVIESDQFCKNCRPKLHDKLRNQIDRCIESLINDC